MPDLYYVNCPCGGQIAVEMRDAGTSQACPKCRAAIDIPGSTKLKQLNGDNYPLLSAIDKIRETARKHEPPFDGVCHGCRQKPADFSIPVRFTSLLERQVYGDDGVGISPLGGLQLAVGDVEEQWQQTTIPLLLCERCQAEFELEIAQSSRTSMINSALTWAALAALIGGLALWMPVVIFVLLLAIGAAFLFLNIHLIGFVWAISSTRPKKKRHDHETLVRWVSRIRWMPDVFASQMEYAIQAGEAQRVSDRR